MASKSSWKVEAIQCHFLTEEIVDWIEINPGPIMRSWLDGKFYRFCDHESSPQGVMLSRGTIMLQVTHLPSGRYLRSVVVREGGRRKYRTRYTGESPTLEAAVKAMKGDLKNEQA